MILKDSKILFIFWIRSLLEFGFEAHKKVIQKELPTRGKILDVGCGIGNLATHFSQRFYYGIDIDVSRIDYAKKHFKGNFLLASATKLPFKEKFFDGILVVALFHHLDGKDVPDAIEELKRVVKKNGRVVVIEDYRPTFRQNPLIHALYSVDFSGKFRDVSYYKTLFSRSFQLHKFYPLNSGLWQYQVYVLEK